MPIELWGATGSIGVIWPDRPVGVLFLGIYGLFLLFAFFHYRDTLRRMSSRQWLGVAGLSLLSLFVSQLFPIRLAFDNQLAPLSVAQNPVTSLTLFAAAPFLLAGAVLNPVAALIVGLFSGLGRALGQSHYPFDIFNFALAAVLAAIWMQQSYQGRFYKWLRQPVVAGALNTVGLIFWVGVATFASTEMGASNLAALDLSLSTAASNFWPLLIEGAVGGGLVMLVLLGLPQLKPTRKMEPSPARLSLRNRLLSNFALFAVSLTLLLIVVVFNLSVNVSTRLVVNQMAHNAQTVSAGIPNFQEQLQTALLQYSEQEGLFSEDTAENEKTLEQLFRASPSYRRVLLVDSENGVIASYPPNDAAAIDLTEQEETAVSRALTTITPDITPAQTSADEHILSFVVPVHREGGLPTTALIGRVPQLSLDNLIIGLQGTVGQGNGFIVDEHQQIIAHSDSDTLLTNWSPPENVRPIQSADTLESGMAYQGRQGQTNARELVYFTESDMHSWTVVINVPYEVVLNLALGIGAPLTLALLLAMAAFYTNLAVIGRDITNPITELVRASKTIAAGEKWTLPEQTRRDDEIGQLTRAFSQMHQSRNKRLNELSLLLNVSHEVSTRVDIKRGMSVILRGALRGTRAAGARAVVLNPSGGYPLQFGEGPTSESMAALDRRIMSRLRHGQELLLSSADEIREALGLPATAVIPVPALMAIPLHSHDRFQGILWLGYRQPHSFEQAEQDLLKTLAGQTAVLVENARLFATAEGGRRRLAAVLASTSDAVIVTDQTNRVLLVNRAMERIFNLKANRVIGRPLTDVVKTKELVAALSGTEERARNLEIPTEDDKTYYASASTIYNNDGQEMGRVAVLHDITHLKEIEKMKSEFVETITHDLNGPLSVMSGHVTLLTMAGEVNEDQQASLDKIRGSIDKMAEMVKAILHLGRIEAGIPLNYEEIDASALLSEIAADHWPHAHEAKLKIEVEAAPELPHVQGDRQLVRRALVNLLINAFNYAPNSDHVLLKAESKNGEMVFCVQDRGPGISEEHQIRIFEKFYRVRQHDVKGKKGTGLGLAMVKSTAERHGGRAWLRSKTGHGSAFYFSVPLQPPNQNGQT